MAPPEQDELKAVLLNIEQHHLKGLLEDVEGWNTKYIDYHPLESQPGWTASTTISFGTRGPLLPRLG